MRRFGESGIARRWRFGCGRRATQLDLAQGPGCYRRNPLGVTATVGEADAELQMELFNDID